MVETLCNAGVPVVGESETVATARIGADVGAVLFEPMGSGLDNVLELTRQRNVHLVATIASTDATGLQEVAESGVAGILVLDDLTPELLVETVFAVRLGRTSLPRELLPRLLERAAERAVLSPDRLTPRERAVLRLLAEGEETRGIATRLNYSERTVKNVVHDVLTKLDCRTRAQAVGLATRAGVI
jgi:DNA-binding NarL/FixJ family response regulator